MGSAFYRENKESKKSLYYRRRNRRDGAARVLKLREHDPVIYEKNNVLGGTFIPASAESYKGKLRELLAWYRRQMKELDGGGSFR